MSPQGAPRRSVPRPSAKLIIRENGSERIVDLKVRTTIGRAQENDIAIDDINSSRRHCQIERNPNGYEVVDLKSRNGTLVNGILSLSDGPRDILGPNPVAHLTGAAERREPIEMLVTRVAEWEARQ